MAEAEDAHELVPGRVFAIDPWIKWILDRKPQTLSAPRLSRIGLYFPCANDVMSNGRSHTTVSGEAVLGTTFVLHPKHTGCRHWPLGDDELGAPDHIY